MQQLALFEKPPAKPRRVLMHVFDASPCGYVRFACSKCHDETDWLFTDSEADAKRGIPCPKCNPQPVR